MIFLLPTPTMRHPCAFRQPTSCPPVLARARLCQVSCILGLLHPKFRRSCDTLINIGTSWRHVALTRGLVRICEGGGHGRLASRMRRTRRNQASTGIPCRCIAECVKRLPPLLIHPVHLPRFWLQLEHSRRSLGV